MEPSTWEMGFCAWLILPAPPCPPANADLLTLAQFRFAMEFSLFILLADVLGVWLTCSYQD